jgi:hypothetical protein
MNTTATTEPECPYCGATDGLRMKCDGGGYVAPEYTCGDCFTGTDDGPCFDDLPAVTTWPKRPDGSNMTIGEMSLGDRRTQMAAANARVMGGRA